MEDITVPDISNLIKTASAEQLLALDKLFTAMFAFVMQQSGNLEFQRMVPDDKPVDPDTVAKTAKQRFSKKAHKEAVQSIVVFVCALVETQDYSRAEQYIHTTARQIEDQIRQTPTNH